MRNLWMLLFLLVLVACKGVENTEKFHFVFLNWAESSTATSMQVNVATSKDFENWQLHVREEGKGHFIGHDLVVKEHDQLKKSFNIHYNLQNLKPDTWYDFFLTADTFEGKIYRFKTLPENLEEIRFVVGGDTGAGSKFNRMSEIASTYEFDLAVFGGDIAYADGDVKNYKRWIDWMSIWTKASTKGNQLIPFIIAIGNHETNYNFLNSKEDRAPFYFSWFNQDEDAHFVRDVAGQKFIILDTGHISSYSSQKEFLRNSLSKNKDQFQFTFYHIPFFPGHRSPNGQARAGRDAWMSIMEEFEVDVSFEHHDHVMKRTFPLKDMQVVNDKGIIYLGDGAMGKSTRELNHEWYLERATSENHFWYVIMKKNKAKFQAIGMDNQPLDEFEIRK